MWHPGTEVMVPDLLLKRFVSLLRATDYQWEEAVTGVMIHSMVGLPGLPTRTRVICHAE